MVSRNLSCFSTQCHVLLLCVSAICFLNGLKLQLDPKKPGVARMLEIIYWVNAQKRSTKPYWLHIIFEHNKRNCRNHQALQNGINMQLCVIMHIFNFFRIRIKSKKKNYYILSVTELFVACSCFIWYWGPDTDNQNFVKLKDKIQINL